MKLYLFKSDPTKFIDIKDIFFNMDRLEAFHVKHVINSLCKDMPNSFFNIRVFSTSNGNANMFFETEEETINELKKMFPEYDFTGYKIKTFDEKESKERKIKELFD